MRDRDARGNQNSPKEQEHTHPVESGERKIVRAQQDHQSRKKQVQIVVTYGHKKQHRKRQNNATCIPRKWNELSLLTDAGRPDKRSSSCVSGKMKNPPMTTARIDAFGVTHVPSAADTSQITDETSCPQKPPM